jgi:hypothetical protein
MSLPITSANGGVMRIDWKRGTKVPLFYCPGIYYFAIIINYA